MARSNKYTSLNFNDIYDKKLNNNNNQTINNNSSGKSLSSPGASFGKPSKTIISNSRIHGHMLVLNRPTPKPISIPVKPSIEQQDNKEKCSVTSELVKPSIDQARSDPEPDSISLRPQGRTGSTPTISSSPLQSPVSPLRSPAKTNCFVPPHLRPGFVGKEEKPGLEIVKGGSPGGFKNRQDFGGHRPGPVQDPGHYASSPNRFGKDGRPKSGGGYERMRRGGEPADLIHRPGPSGNRPSSSG